MGKFLLVNHHWHVNVFASIEERHTGSSLFLQRCLACLVHLTGMVFEMGGKRPYSCCYVRCSFQDLFGIARSFFCSSSIAFFSVLSASMWCIHTVVLRQPLLGRNSVSF